MSPADTLRTAAEHYRKAHESRMAAYCIRLAQFATTTPGDYTATAGMMLRNAERAHRSARVIAESGPR